MDTVVDLSTPNCKCIGDGSQSEPADLISRTDIEQETNGLYTFDRKEKLPADEVNAIIQEACRIYFERSKSIS